MSTASRKQAASKAKREANRLRRLIGDRRVAWYKWEFLRRNEEYQKDYAAFAEQFAEWLQKCGDWIPPESVKQDPEASSFFRKEVIPAAAKIIDRWGLSDPVDPTRSFDPSQPWSDGRPPHFGKSHRDQIEPELLEPELPEEEKRRIRETLSYSLLRRNAPTTAEGLRFIQVSIDIAQTLESIFDELEKRIESARLHYRVEIGPLPDFRKRPRIRLDQYDICLKVWDLRKQNLTFDEIACRLFPLEMKNPAFRSTLTKRVRSQFQRAKELIEGGYRQLEG